MHYVALGDSYSSGVGAGSYISSSGSCDRSPNAYSALWAAAHAPATYTSVACSGATTSTVINTPAVRAQLEHDAGQHHDRRQRRRLREHHGDVRARRHEFAASPRSSRPRTTRRARCPALLNTVYNDIRSHAPNAHVVVLDYPVFYQLGTFCIGLSATSHAKIDEGINIVDGVISTAASQHGFTFGDVRSQFAAGHQLCGSGTNWLHSLNITDITESYHPTAAGQSGGYLPVFTTAAG